MGQIYFEILHFSRALLTDKVWPQKLVISYWGFLVSSAKHTMSNRNRASASRDVRVPFSKEPGTRLKIHFCAFLDTLMSGYNLSSILEQVTTDSRVPENGEPIWVPGS